MSRTSNALPAATLIRELHRGYVHRCNPRFKSSTDEWLVVHAHFVVAGGVCLLSSLAIIGALIWSQLQLSTAQSTGRRGFWTRFKLALAKSEATKLIVLSVLLSITFTNNLCKSRYNWIMNFAKVRA